MMTKGLHLWKIYYHFYQLPLLLRSDTNLQCGTKFQGINYWITERLVVIPAVSTQCFDLHLWRLHKQYGDHSSQCQLKQVAHFLLRHPVLSVPTYRECFGHPLILDIFYNCLVLIQQCCTDKTITMSRMSENLEFKYHIFTFLSTESKYLINTHPFDRFVVHHPGFHQNK